MAKIVFGLVACLLLALSACTSAESMSMQIRFTGVAYDTVKDPNTAGVYRSRSAFDGEHEGQSEQIKAQTLLNGVQALQKAGYDYVAWRGPLPASLVKTTKTSYGATISTEVYRGFDFDVQGWKSADGNVRPGARPISVALAELQSQVEQARPASATTASTGTATRPSHFDWPVKGESVVHFGTPNSGPKVAYGILIRTSEGAIVKAADSGVVAAAGPTTVIITHPGGYLTQYSCISPVLVKQDATVWAGQPIGKVGKSGTCKEVPDSGLKFVIFGKKEYVDPLSVLPPR